MDQLIHSAAWLIIAKVLLVIFMLASGSIALLIVVRKKAWMESLKELEMLCDIGRDTAMIQCTVARSQLVEFQEKLKSKPERTEIEMITKLVKQSLPVLSLLMNKETNLLKWGFAGAKLVQSAFDYFSKKNRN